MQGVGGARGEAQKLALTWAHLQDRCPRLCRDLRLRALGGSRESASCSRGNIITAAMVHQPVMAEKARGVGLGHPDV